MVCSNMSKEIDRERLKPFVKSLKLSALKKWVDADKLEEEGYYQEAKELSSKAFRLSMLAEDLKKVGNKGSNSEISE